MQKLSLIPLAILIILEEWLWDLFSLLGHYLIKLLQLQRFEVWLTQTTPNMALLTFMIPVLIVTPINLLAIALMLNGLLLQGILLEIMAKLLGTLLVARVFTLTKNQLLTFTVIATIYGLVSRCLKWAHEKIANTKIYQLAHKLKLEIKILFAAFFRNKS